MLPSFFTSWTMQEEEIGNWIRKLENWKTVEYTWPLRAPSTQLESTDTVPVILYYFLFWKTKKSYVLTQLFSN